MTNDISGFGTVVALFATTTFPGGIEITQFSDDVDAFDTPAIQVADKKKGLNGDMVVWSVASAIDVTLSVISGSDDDINLGILLEANRPARGKIPARDSITATRTLPDGSALTLTNGVITNGAVGSSVASAGRQKTKVYTFAFEDRAGAPS